VRGDADKRYRIPWRCENYYYGIGNILVLFTKRIIVMLECCIISYNEPIYN